MKDLVELEIRELLEAYGYPDDLPVVKGSARSALEEEFETELGTGSVKELMNIVDTYINNLNVWLMLHFYYRLKVL